MKIVHDHVHLGSEFDWLAVDEHGRCFFICTAGFGWVPASVVVDPYPSLALSLVLGLPVYTKAIIHRSTGNSTEWSDAAARGFYSVDWDHETAAYILVAEPAVPILSVQLPVAVLRVAAMALVELNSSNHRLQLSSPSDLP